MQQKLVRKQSGFTIIEVMIVLAIAGLIMLIVFLAVPALQRSQHNTQRRTDVGAVATAFANYVDNNGGTMPKTVGISGNDVLLCGATCAAGNTETAHLGFILPTNISLVTSSASPGTPTKDTVIIDVNYACNATSTGLGSAATRTTAILYANETSASSVAQQCLQQ